MGQRSSSSRPVLPRRAAAPDLASACDRSLSDGFLPYSGGCSRWICFGYGSACVRLFGLCVRPPDLFFLLTPAIDCALLGNSPPPDRVKPAGSVDTPNRLKNIRREINLLCGLGGGECGALSIRAGTQKRVLGWDCLWARRRARDLDTRACRVCMWLGYDSSKQQAAAPRAIEVPPLLCWRCWADPD